MDYAKSYCYINFLFIILLMENQLQVKSTHKVSDDKCILY